MRNFKSEPKPKVVCSAYQVSDVRSLMSEMLDIHDDVSLSPFVIPGLTSLPRTGYEAGMTCFVVINDAVYNQR